MNETRGPQGHISAKTVTSIDLNQSRLERLRVIGNLLSCVTLDVENCRATVHFKQANMSVLEYSRAFGTTMKESIKRITHQGAFYYTSTKSWYPKPDKSLHFLQVPVVKLVPAMEMSQDDCETLRNWAKAHSAAVSQRTVC